MGVMLCRGEDRVRISAMSNIIFTGKKKNLF